MSGDRHKWKSSAMHHPVLQRARVSIGWRALGVIVSVSAVGLIASIVWRILPQTGRQTVFVTNPSDYRRPVFAAEAETDLELVWLTHSGAITSNVRHQDFDDRLKARKIVRLAAGTKLQVFGTRESPGLLSPDGARRLHLIRVVDGQHSGRELYVLANDTSRRRPPVSETVAIQMLETESRAAPPHRQTIENTFGDMHLSPEQLKPPTRPGRADVEPLDERELDRMWKALEAEVGDPPAGGVRLRLPIDIENGALKLRAKPEDIQIEFDPAIPADQHNALPQQQAKPDGGNRDVAAQDNAAFILREEWRADFENVRGVAMTPNGRKIAVATNWKVLLLSNSNGHVIRELPIAAKTVANEIAFTPDGVQLAVTSNVGVEFVSSSGERTIAPIPVVGTAPLFSPDGKLFLCRSGNTIRIVAVSRRKPQAAMTHGGSVSAAFSTDGKEVVSVGNAEHGIVVRWNAETGERVQSVPLKRQWTGFRTAAISTQSGRVVIGEPPGFGVYDLSSGEHLATIEHLGGAPLVLSGDGRFGFVSGGKGELVVFDLATGVQVAKDRHELGIVDLAASSDGTRIVALVRQRDVVTQQDSTSVRLWKLEPVGK